jgi:SAM-dependent methyltransferase
MSVTWVDSGNAAQAEYWNGSSGRRWTERQEMQDAMLRPISDRLLATALPQTGERVIDVGCGCGATTIEVARRVAPEGDVLGLDISAPMLERARQRAPADLPLSFALADATIHDFAPGAADLVVSRFGVMFFADPVLAFANLRKGLRRGGRIAFACWRAAKLNLWAVTPLREALKHAPPLPEAGPEEPGPFSFADEERVSRILGEAGFDDILLAPHALDVDIAMGRGLDEAVVSAMSIGPTSRMLADQSEEVRAAVAADIRAAFAPLARGDRVPLGAAVWIVTAVNPRQ